MALSAIQVAEVSDLLSRYSDARVPPGVREEIRLGFRINGNSVTLFETRPRFQRPEEWAESPVARFRYNKSQSEWALFWRDRNQRWHRYDLKRPSKRLQTLLNEVDRDPTGIFWG